jgi:signal transduction histidine kinase
MKKIKSETAITLIALIITVIILLILAGVSLNALVGDNGIIVKSTEAKLESEEAELKEQVEMIVADTVGELVNNPMSQNEIRDYIKEKFNSQNLKATIDNDEDGFVIVYGIQRKNIWYLNGELKDFREEGAVVGSTDDWKYKIDSETRKSSANSI